MSANAVTALYAEYLQHGPDLHKGQGRGRAPNWTKDDSARLCHVIADPGNAIILAKLYQRISSRAELDIQRHDPFVYEFCTMFNDSAFMPVRPVPVDGITEDVLLGIDPSKPRHRRQGQQLKQKWTKLRSSYSVSLRNFQASGQGDREAFPDFTRGDDVLSYMHCVFHSHPSLDAVVRMLPSCAQVEAGVDSSYSQQGTEEPLRESMSRKRRRDDGASVLANAIHSLANSQRSEQPIIVQNQGPTGNSSDKSIPELDRAAKISSTVSTLMDLESKIMMSMERIPPSYSDVERSNLRQSLQRRLNNVQKMIEDAMSKQ